MASSYGNFAQVYDELMDNVPYDEWAVYIKEQFLKYGIEEGLVCELGCGTGNITRRLSSMGYDMIGLDSSADMLEIAREKQGSASVLYLFQDMREFELYGTVRACISICDSINYLLSEEELMQTFRLVNNYLDPGGIFLFDFNTDYKYREIIGDTVIAENREDCSFIWENYYDMEECVNEYDLTVFVRNSEEREETYRKFTETHFQRGYTLAQMKRLLEEAGLLFLEAVDADTREGVRESSERIYVIARENGKQKGTEDA